MELFVGVAVSVAVARLLVVLWALGQPSSRGPEAFADGFAAPLLAFSGYALSIVLMAAVRRFCAKSAEPTTRNRVRRTRMDCCVDDAAVGPGPPPAKTFALPTAVSAWAGPCASS